MKTILILLIFGQAAILGAPGCCSTNVLPSGPLTEGSVYQVESRWTSDYGKPFQLRQLQGKPQVVTLFFASCEFACPILVHDMQKIEAALAAKGIKDFGLVLVTIDPERDTAERLHAFRRQRGLDDRWLLLRGSSEDVLELAALLGVKFKKDGRGQYAHSNLISVLNQEGEIIHQTIGLNTLPDAAAAAVEAALHSGLK